MKAQRRHELKQNTLARGLENLPEVSRQHGSKILVAVLVALLVVFLVRQRIASSREAATRAAHSLDAARAVIAQLDEPRLAMVQNAQVLANVRQQVYSEATDKLQIVLDATDDPRLLAEARLARGDLNWKLANFPDLPGAQTQPALQFSRSRQDLLKAAADSYLNVIEDPAAPPESMRTAHLGLAAVYENRREWDKARAEYQKVVNDTSVPKPFKDLAVDRLNNFDQIQNPPLIAGPATAESTLPTISAATTTSPSSAPVSSTAPASGEAPVPASATAPQAPAPASKQ